MKTARILATTLTAAVGLVAFAAPAAAERAPVSCGDVVSGYLDDDAGWLDVVASRVTARGDLGFSAFSMRDGFQIEDDPLHTAAAGNSYTFSATRQGDYAFVGYFHTVFTDRGNGDEDRSRLWLSSGGNLWIRSITWDGSWTRLENPVCYEGPQGQLVMTGQIDTTTHGTTFWTFLMQQRRLI